MVSTSDLTMAISRDSPELVRNGRDSSFVLQPGLPDGALAIPSKECVLRPSGSPNGGRPVPRAPGPPHSKEMWYYPHIKAEHKVKHQSQTAGNGEEDFCKN